MSESLSIKEAHVWIVSISTGTKNALFAEVPLAQADAKPLGTAIGYI